MQDMVTTVHLQKSDIGLLNCFIANNVDRPSRSSSRSF